MGMRALQRAVLHLLTVMCMLIGLADQPRQDWGDSVEVLPELFHRAERDAKTAPLRYKIISYVLSLIHI